MPLIVVFYFLQIVDPIKKTWRELLGKKTGMQFCNYITIVSIYFLKEKKIFYLEQITSLHHLFFSLETFPASKNDENTAGINPPEAISIVPRNCDENELQIKPQYVQILKKTFSIILI